MDQFSVKAIAGIGHLFNIEWTFIQNPRKIGNYI